MAEKQVDTLGRTPPEAPEIERAILGAMMFDPEAIGITVEMNIQQDFSKPAHGIMYRAMVDLYDQNVPVDQLTVAEQLKQMGKLETVGGEDFIAGLVSETTSSANIEYHCTILKEKSFLRNLITATTAVRNRCFDDSAQPSEVLDNLEQSIMQLSQQRLTKSYDTIEDRVHEAHEGILERIEATGGLTGIDTGFKRLNTLTSGWQKSDLVIIAGRPSMGKTAFALDLAKNAAAKEVPVGVFSLEMSTKQLVMRMLFNEGRFDGSPKREAKPSQGDLTRLSDACNRLYKYPIYIDDTPGLSPVELAAKAKRMKAERDVGLIIVDYLQLMQDQRRESRQQEISAISRSLKNLAKELDVPIIALSQLSRALEQRHDHRPLLSDLRESGAIEQDADLVIFIYRAAVYDDDNPEYSIMDQNVAPENVAEVIIRKQRNGPIGSILLHWIEEYTKFAEFDYQDSEGYF